MRAVGHKVCVLLVPKRLRSYKYLTNYIHDAHKASSALSVRCCPILIKGGIRRQILVKLTTGKFYDNLFTRS